MVATTQKNANTLSGSKVAKTILALNAAGKMVVVPSFFDVIAPFATGDASTDTGNLQACFDAIPASGGSIYIPPGAYAINPLTVSNPTKIVGGGVGPNPTAPTTRLVFSGSTGDAITVSADGCDFSNFGVINTSASAPTAGTGIRFTAGDFARLDNVVVHKFYDNVRFDNGYYLKITNCCFVDAVRRCLWLANSTAGQGDYGDYMISNNLFGGYSTSRIPNAGVYWQSGGGMKFVGNKINGSITPGGAHSSVEYGILVEIAAGVSTTVMTVAGNSIEGWNAGGLVIRQDGVTNTGTFGKIAISGNEIAGNSGVGVKVAAQSGAGSFRELVVDANSIGNCSSGITYENIDTVVIGSNTFKAVTGAIISALGGVTNDLVLPQSVYDDNINLFTTSSRDAQGTRHLEQQVPMDFSREVPSTTSTSTYTTLWRVSWPNYATGRLDLTISGQINGLGGAFFTGSRSIVRGNGGSATATTIGTDTFDGASGSGVAMFDVLFDTATVAGEVQIKVRLKSGVGGSDLIGLAQAKMSGNFSAVKKGA